MGSRRRNGARVATLLCDLVCPCRNAYPAFAASPEAPPQMSILAPSLGALTSAVRPRGPHYS